jgi:hypothetical protein
MPPGLQLWLAATVLPEVIVVGLWLRTGSYPEDFSGVHLLAALAFGVIAIPWWIAAFVQATLSKLRFEKHAQ